MKKSFSNILKYILFLAIGIFLCYLAFRNQDINALISEISQADYRFVLLSMSMGLFAYLSRAHRWLLMLEPLGYKPRFISSYYGIVMGYLANLALPRVGEVTRCGTLSELEDIPLNVLIGTVIIERLIDTIVLGSCLLIAIGIKPEIVEPVVKYIVPKDPLSFMLKGAIVLALLILIIFLLSKNKNAGSWTIKLYKLFNGIKEGFLSIRNVKNIPLFIFHTFFIWFMYYMMIYVCFFALESTSALGIGEGFYTLVAGGLGMSMPVQGGIGVYHLFVSECLKLFGISENDGIIFATLVHASQVLLILVLGIMAFIGMIILKNKKVTVGKG